MHGVITRLYAHNFRCLQNFELKLGADSTILLIGRNGSGKSTVRKVLEILQSVARGENRVGSLVKPRDFFLNGGAPTSPRVDSARMRFEIECTIGDKSFRYTLALELPPDFVELRVAEESLHIDQKVIYSRELSEVSIPRQQKEAEARFRLDWHVIALPVVQERSPEDPLFIFKQFLRSFVILAPLPSLIHGESKGDTLQPAPSGENFAAWFTGLLAFSPSSYSVIESYMKAVFPDFHDIQNPLSGTDSRNMTVQFHVGGKRISLPLEVLSDGEKCYLISALLLASFKTYTPSLCFWDEPDNHLSLGEIGHFIMALRKLPSGAQLIATSHHPETIRRFSDENTLVLHRPSHLEPTQVRPLSELNIHGDLIEALILGDVLS